MNNQSAGGTQKRKRKSIFLLYVFLSLSSLLIYRFSYTGNEVSGEVKEISKNDSGKVLIEDEELPESFHEHLMKIEGMGVSSEKHRDLAQRLFDGLGDPAFRHKAFELIKDAKSITDKKAQDITFVFGLMALSLEGQGQAALNYLKQFKPHFTWMDEHECLYHSDDMLRFAYAWLINNTEVTVPCWFIQRYPDIFYKKTPLWAATRDAYFSVCTPDNSELKTLPAFLELQEALDDAANPGDCFLGSIAYARHKSLEIEKGLLANRPDYYTQNIIRNDRSKWLDYWQYLGPYNFGVAERIRQAAIRLQLPLINMLIKNGNLNKADAEATAGVYINNMIADAIGWSYEPYEEYIEALNTHGWEKWDGPPDRWRAAEIIGGYLLYERSVDQFIGYVKWLKANAAWEAIYSLINTAAVVNSDALDTMLDLDIPILKTSRVSNEATLWGAFNKSPLLYAVQYNNQGSYLMLKNIRAMDTLTTNDGSTYLGNCEIPRIGKRNVLTYAAENASAPLLFEVIQDFGKKYGESTDTAGRNITTYLFRNTNLSKDDLQRALVLLGENLPEDDVEKALALSGDNMKLAQFFYDRNDMKLSIHYLQLAAKENNPDALYQLGMHAMENKQYADAVAYYEKTLGLSPHNNAARLELAQMYVNGHGLSKDIKTAFQLMKHIADNEIESNQLRAIAELSVGIYFLRGMGVEPSTTEAGQYLRKAIHHGREKIHNALRLIVETGVPYEDLVKKILQYELKRLNT